MVKKQTIHETPEEREKGDSDPIQSYDSSQWWGSILIVMGILLEGLDIAQTHYIISTHFLYAIALLIAGIVMLRRRKGLFK